MIALNGREAPDSFRAWEHNQFGLKEWRNIIDITHAKSTTDVCRLDDLNCALNVPIPLWVLFRVIVPYLQLHTFMRSLFEERQHLTILVRPDDPFYAARDRWKQDKARLMGCLNPDR